METGAATIPDKVESMPNQTPATKIVETEVREFASALPTYAVESAVRPMAEHAHRVHFYGSGGELFSIYLINLFKTIMTAGLYSFWGKTKVRRYVWGASEFAGDRFTYHGTGKELFIGWLKAVTAFGLLAGLPALLTWAWTDSVTQFVATAIYYAGLGLLLPIARMGSLRYRLSRTSWRGIRFSFQGRYLPLIRLSLRGYFYTLMTFGLYFPYYQNEMRRFLTKHAFFGSRHFKFDGRGKALFRPYLTAVGLTLGTVLVGFPIMAGTLSLFIDKAFVPIIVVLVVLGALATIWIWYGATQRRYYWDHTSFGGTPFKSSITPSSLLALYAGNLAILVLTLGLALPWIKVRTMNYEYERLALNGALHLDGVVQQPQLASASGDELAAFIGAGDLAA